jgi:hypothetical protein
VFFPAVIYQITYICHNVPLKLTFLLNSGLLKAHNTKDSANPAIKQAEIINLNGFDEYEGAVYAILT